MEGTISIAGSAGREDAADGVDRELMDRAGARRTQFDTLEVVVGGNAPFGQLGDLALDLAQFLLGLGPQVLIDTRDLQFDLGDLALGLRDLRGQLTFLTGEADGLTFEPVQPHDRGQSLFVELPDPLQFFGDDLRLACVCVELRAKTENFVLELGDPLGELRALAFARRTPRIEQPAFGGDDPLRLGIVRPAGEICRNLQCVASVALGFEAPLATEKLIELAGDHLEIGARDGLVETDEQVALRNLVAFAHQDLADNAAGRMLHFLDVAIDDELARSDHRVRHGGGDQPERQRAAEDRDEHEATPP